MEKNEFQNPEKKEQQQQQHAFRMPKKKGSRKGITLLSTTGVAMGLRRG